MSARDRIRKFFKKNVGKIVNTQEIRKIAGISEYARRIRELRDEEGMQILSHRDRSNLKPGEYILITLKRRAVIGRDISYQLRTEILERNGYTCQMCGAGPETPDPLNPKRKSVLMVDHIMPISQGGTNHKDNLRVLCAACNQGRANIQTPSESTLNLMARLRRASRDTRREIYEILRKEFLFDFLIVFNGPTRVIVPK